MGLQVQEVFLMMLICYSSCGESAVTLSLLDSENHIVCPNKTIEFQCVTSNTRSLTWKSIATNSTLQFIVNMDRPGDGKVVDDALLGTICAQLHDIDDLGGGLYMLNSTLRIDVPPGIFNTTISCFDEDENAKSLTYSLSVTPNGPMFSTSDQNTCILSDQNLSLTLAWIPPSNMDMFTPKRYYISYFNTTLPIPPTQREYSLTIPIGNANSITVGITAVSMCGQRSETSTKTISMEDCKSTACRLESFMIVTIVLFCFGLIIKI